jgi:hypothetical protein
MKKNVTFEEIEEVVVDVKFDPEQAEEIKSLCKKAQIRCREFDPSKYEFKE